MFINPPACSKEAQKIIKIIEEMRINFILSFSMDENEKPKLGKSVLFLFSIRLFSPLKKKLT